MPITDLLLEDLSRNAPVRQVLVGAFWTAVVVEAGPVRCGLASTLRGEARAKGSLQSPGPEGSFVFAHGILNVGEMMAVPVIRQLKQWVTPPHRNEALGAGPPVILDAPPGNACPVVEVMQGTDLVLLVTEPTPFGLHDLRQAAEVARDEMGLPVGVVINREGVGDQGVDAYCEEKGIPILMRIPLERGIAEAYSEGVRLVEALPEYLERFQEVYRRIEELADAGTTA